MAAEKMKQQEQLAKTHASAERLSRTETDSRPASAVSRSYSDVADIRHFAPQDDPDAIYTRPMKLKRRSVESKGTPPRIPEESVMLPAGMSPVESPSSPPPPVPPPVALSPIDEGTTQMTVHAVIENHDENSPSDDVRTSPPASPARTTSPDRLSAVLPHDGRTSRRRSVDELTTMSEKHHQGEVMDAFKFLEDFDDVMPSGKD
ncbi:hypothetical protein LSAT2_015094 [Lamellibrachia satsuma]|nr:hypothetical protein LSAT2_015094 [Lamellibrachia satsuma]